QHRVHSTNQKTTIRAEADHTEALRAALGEVPFAHSDHAAAFASRCDCIFDLQQLLADAGALPLTGETGRAGIVGWPEHKHVHTFTSPKLANLLPAANRFDHRYDQNIFVRVRNMLRYALSPSGGPFGADTAQTSRWVMRKRH